MGSISDIVALSDYRRFRAWLLASCVAVLGVIWIEAAGITDLSETMYMMPSLNWAGNIIGGLLFGFGMAFAGGCVSKNLARTGGGDMRSLVVLIVIGIFGYITIGGILGPIRAAIEQATSIDLAEQGLESQGLGQIVSAVSGIEADSARLAVAILLALAIAAYCFKDANFRTSKPHVIGGIVVGLCVTAGWALTGLAADEFADVPVAVASLTFVRPAGDSLEYLMRYTALGFPGFGISTLVGTILGAFIAAKLAGSFRLATFADTKDMKRNLFGAMLMGIGGVLALGCTVGQAVTGVSTLAVGSVLTFAAIVIGGFIGVNTLNRIIMSEI